MMKKKFFSPSTLLKPSSIFAGMIIGICIGLISKNFAIHLDYFGKIYLNLIQMIVLPIMITAVVSSFGNLFSSHLVGEYVKKIFFTFIIGLIIAGILGILIGITFAPGSHLTDSEKILLSQIISQSTPIGNSSNISSGWLSFINNIIPTNIFSALSSGNMLAVLFFSILLGIALGCVRSPLTKTTLNVIEGVFSALLKIVSWIMYGLPIGLCFLFAGYTAHLGLSELMILSRLICVFYLAFFSIFILYTIVAWRYLGGSYFESIKALKEPLLIAFGTSSSFSSIPFMLENLQHKCHLNKDVVDFVVPLGINLNRHGTVIRLVIGTIFTAQLFNQPLSFSHLMIILFISIIASVASSGVPGMAGIGVLELVLQPLGLPTAVGITLLAAIVPVTDAFITLVNVYGNCVTSIIVAKKKGQIIQHDKHT